MTRRATARAHANIALVKYWGKRQSDLNLPANGSLSLTLDAMHTTTAVEWTTSGGIDEVALNGSRLEGRELAKIGAWLDRVRQLAGIQDRARIETVNNFPTAAGLASSASAYAALALAATAAAGLDLSPRDLSILARQGSGSAARSIFGGFVEWQRGDRPDGQDSFAEPILAPEDWDVRMLVAVLEPGPKPISSRDGMTVTTETSPMYGAWLATVEADLAAMREAVLARDLDRVGAIAEANCLKMHATMITSSPMILYWQPATVALMHRVVTLRHAGLGAYFTMDAGPNVKVLCAPGDAERLKGELLAVPGVQEVLMGKPGPGVVLL
jgi:diphosphomevalonate decarboxylase